MRGAQSGFLGNDNAAENAFGDTVVTIQLCGEIRLAGELDHGINALGFVFDGVGETTLAPIIDRIDRTVCFDQGLELADQGSGSLLIQSRTGNFRPLPLRKGKDVCLA